MLQHPLQCEGIDWKLGKQPTKATTKHTKKKLTQHCNPTACHSYMLKLFDFVFPNNKLSRFCPIELTFYFSRRQRCTRSSRKRSVQQCGHLAVLSKVLGTNTATQQLLVVSNLMAANCLLRLQNSCPPNNNLNRSFAPFTLIAIGEMCKVAYTAITARSGQKTIPT